MDHFTILYYHFLGKAMADVLVNYRLLCRKDAALLL